MLCAANGLPAPEVALREPVSVRVRRTKVQCPAGPESGYGCLRAGGIRRAAFLACEAGWSLAGPPEGGTWT
jgi:hypothetical protein